ncbi:MAG: hypothetical protein ABR564_03925 [Candidatus Dormibacteria bacterium]
MDEYQLEIQALRQTLGRLKADRADAALIDEYEEELRNLTAIYDAALETLAAGRVDRRLGLALADLGFGAWTLPNVYSFVYEAVLDAELKGHGVAHEARHTDFAGTLLAAFADS